MIRKTIAIILEMIPLISIAISFAGISIRINQVSLLIAVLGFAFSFAGRKLAKEDRIVRVIGVLDWLMTIFAGGFLALLVFDSKFAGS